jgi:allantoicase
VSEDPHLPDLAARPFGGAVLEANDEFFAPKENLLKPEQPVFDPNAYTDRGKEMDGWETRRRRTPGCDWCVVRLGFPGVVRSVVVDTTHFRGNYPDRCSLLGTVVDEGESLSGAGWVELLPESKLEGDTVNRFDVTTPLRITHLQLNIYPDGGVARLRVHGEPLSDLRRLVAEDGRAEVAGSKSGGVVLDASDVFFSHPHNLIAPGDSHGMHDGWETRRRRGPGGPRSSRRPSSVRTTGSSSRSIRRSRRRTCGSTSIPTAGSPACARSGASPTRDGGRSACGG